MSVLSKFVKYFFLVAAGFSIAFAYILAKKTNAHALNNTKKLNQYIAGGPSCIGKTG